MTCECGYQFCWVCLTRWPDEYSGEPEEDEMVQAHDGAYYECPLAADLLAADPLGDE